MALSLSSKSSVPCSLSLLYTGLHRILQDKLEVDDTSLKVYKKALKEVVSYSEAKQDDENDKPSAAKRKVTKTSKEDIMSNYLKNFLTLLLTILSHLLENDAENAHAFSLSVSADSMKQDSTKLNVWCLSSKLVFQELNKKVRAIILASGTLSPLSSFSAELQINFKYSMEGNHVIKPQNLLCLQHSYGLTQRLKLNSSFKNAENSDYFVELGKIILHYVKVGTALRSVSVTYLCIR